MISPFEAPDIALADDIVSELKARRWRLKFDVQRTWVPEWSKQAGELDKLQCAVQPSIQPSGEVNERTDVLETWPIDIAFAVNLQKKTRAEIDTLVRLVDDVRQFLQLQSFVLADGRHFAGMGFEFLLRFDPRTITREIVDGCEAYVGEFVSVFRVPYLLLDPHEEQS